MNPFLGAWEAGTLKTPRDVKALYRLLARKVHPDATGEGDGRGFIRLKADYDQALGWLKSGPPPPAPGLLDAFAEVMASGFPLPPDRKESLPSYRRRLAAFSDLCLRRTPAGIPGFGDFEAQLLGLRGDSVVGNSLFGSVLFVLQTLASHHHNPSRFAAQAVRKVYAEVAPVLGDRGLHQVRGWVGWMVETALGPGQPPSSSK